MMTLTAYRESLKSFVIGLNDMFAIDLNQWDAKFKPVACHLNNLFIH